MAATADSAIPKVTGFGLNHMGFSVSDLERSHDFYVDVVGMEEEGLNEIATDEFNTLMDGEGFHIKFWYLKLDGFRLQLVKYLNGGGDDLTLAHNKRGCPHLCFTVADAQAKYDEIKARGDVRIISEVVTSRYGSMVAHSFYVEDPDGMPIEFGQVEAA